MKNTKSETFNNDSTNGQILQLKMLLMSLKQMIEEKFPFVKVVVEEKNNIWYVKMFYLKWHNILTVFIKYKINKEIYFILQKYSENNSYMLMRGPKDINALNERVLNQIDKCVEPIIALYKTKPLVYRYKNNYGIYQYSLHQFTTKICEPVLVDEIDTNELVNWLHELNFIEEKKLEFVYETVKTFVSDKKKLNNLLYELIKYAS